MTAVGTPRNWYRALAIVLALFILGHTFGTRQAVTNAPQERAVVDAMQGYRVPVMGFLRTYWQFYRGFSVSISILLAALLVFAWQVGTVSRRNPREAVPFGVTLLLACIGQAIIACIYFFTAPIIISIVAVICAGVALALNLRDARSTSGSIDLM